VSAGELDLIVRTPREVVWETRASSIRVPTETGQVGVRPRIESLVLAVEAGLILVRQGEVLRFVGTAGGLFRCNGQTANLLTPLAVTGDNEQQVLDALAAALAQPNVEMQARATIARLQSSILRELREGKKQPLPTVGDRP
jgi:F0F1-type ATP synthase epsilon subunit